MKLYVEIQCNKSKSKANWVSSLIPRSFTEDFSSWIIPTNSFLVENGCSPKHQNTNSNGCSDWERTFLDPKSQTTQQPFELIHWTPCPNDWVPGTYDSNKAANWSGRIHMHFNMQTNHISSHTKSSNFSLGIYSEALRLIHSFAGLTGLRL